MNSNCIFTWGFTRKRRHSFTCLWLWIEFKLYFYVRIHKAPIKELRKLGVVNWIQIVFLREDSQAQISITGNDTRCELNSNCIFTWGFTRSNSSCFSLGRLWIEFKLYFYVRIHKNRINSIYRSKVVNWIQIVFLREDSQGFFINPSILGGCELNSNCIFTWGFTSKGLELKSKSSLWIEFKLYFYVRIHKVKREQSYSQMVVNWIQIVFLREDSQGLPWLWLILLRCELNSNCIFTWGFTSTTEHRINLIMLWIEFKLYFYVRIHKLCRVRKLFFRVVNWIQIVFLREDSQDWKKVLCERISCELNSNCIFTWGFTRPEEYYLIADSLWIEFKLYFYVRIHKFCNQHNLAPGVVNWIQIVFLREDSQVLISLPFSFLCCELNSNCIFTWGFTSTLLKVVTQARLWIEFKLYFYVRIHKLTVIHC